MGFQSSFNQALGTLAGAALGAKHIKGQKESLAEQKMQGKFNVEREVEHEQGSNRATLDKIEQNRATLDKIEQMGAEYDRSLDAMANQNAINDFMAARAGQALANETISKKNTSEATRTGNYNAWIKQYMDWYGVNRLDAKKAYHKENNLLHPVSKEELEEIKGGKE